MNNTEEIEAERIVKEWEKAIKDIQDALNVIGEEFKKLGGCNDGE